MSASPSEPAGRQAPALTRLVVEGVLDSELAALLWLLLEANVGLVISGPRGSGRGVLAGALERLVAGTAKSNGGARHTAWLLEQESLEQVFNHLTSAAVGLHEDQLRSLGLVLIVRDVSGRGRRLIAAHYVRPPERDAGGHVQRRPPAVLAAWDEQADRWDHFAWGVLSELADRCGLAVADFDRRAGQRRRLLEGLVERGALTDDELQAAVSGLAEGEPH